MRYLLLNPDPVAEKLKKDGFVLEDRRMNPDNPDSAVIGFRLEKDGAELVFRVNKKNPTSIIIPFYGLLDKDAGLTNSIDVLIWFLGYICAEDLNLTEARGVVLNTKGIDEDRLKKFYQKLGAVLKTDEEGTEWVVFQLKDLATLRAMYKKQKS